MTSTVPERWTQPRPMRRVLAWATDRRGATWQVTAIVTVTYLLLWSRAVIADRLAVDPLPSLTVVVVGVLLQWGLLRLTHRAFLNRPWWRWHSLTSAVILLIVSVLASIVTVSVATAGFGSMVDGDLSAQTAGMWVQRALALLLITAIWVAVSDYRNVLVEERVEQERLSALLAAGVREVNNQRSTVVKQVMAMLDEALEEMRRGRATSETMASLARERIRPLSHDLASSVPNFVVPEVDAFRSSTLRDVIDRITFTPLARPVLMASAVTFLFMWQTFSTGTPPENANIVGGQTVAPGGANVGVYVDVGSLLWGLFFLFVVFASTWLAGALAIRLLRRALPRMSIGPRLVWLFATPMLIALVVEVVLQVVYVTQVDATSLDRSLWERTVIAAPIFVIAIAMAVVRGVAGLTDSVAQAHADLTKQLSWQVTRTQETLIQERNWLANELHGKVQSIVAATAIELELEDRSSQSAWDKAATKLRSALDSLMHGPTVLTTVRQHLDDLSLTWSGVCEVQWDIDPEVVARIDDDWVALRTVTRIITDGIANSAMHGKAGHVHVLIMKEQPDEFLLMICDNGRGQEAASAPGLGSLNLDSVSLRWSLTHGMTGTGLSVVLPLPKVRDEALVNAS